MRAHPELFAQAAALRLELPGRSAAQIASILYHRHGITVSERTVRGQLRRAGLVPLQNVVRRLTCRFSGSAHAARWYSLITPPRIFRRCTGASSGTTTGPS